MKCVEGVVEWSSIKVPTDVALCDILGTPDGNLVVVGEDSTVLTSEDGGGHWTAQDCGVKKVFFKQIAVDGRGWLYVAGFTPRGSALLRSKDGGVRWKKLPIGRRRYLKTVAVFGEEIYAVDHKSILRSVDSGKSFDAVYDGYNSIENLWGQTPDRIVAVGYDTIRISENRGESWEKRPHDVPAHLGGYDGCGDMRVAVGADSVIVSHDRGDSWERVVLPGNHLNDVVAVSPEEIVVVAGVRSGRILLSKDGGRSFEQEETPVLERARRIQVIGTKLYVVGDSGSLYCRDLLSTLDGEHQKACSKSVVLRSWEPAGAPKIKPDPSAEAIHGVLRDHSDQTYLFLTTDNVVSLEALVDYPLLERVTLWGKIPKDLSPLARLPNLKELGLLGRVRDLSVVGSLAELTTLELKGSAPDLSPLKRCANLRALKLEECTNVTLVMLPQLRALVLPKKGCDLAPLSAMPALEDLTVYKGWRDLDGMALPLKSLGLNAAGVDDLEVVQGFDALESLTAYGNVCAIRDLSPLSGLSRLKSIYITNPPVSDLSPLSKLPALTAINLGKTQIESIVSEPGSWPALTYLTLGGSASLKVIEGLRYASKLEGLELSGTKVAELSPLSGLKSLKRLNVKNGSVRDITPLFGLPSLETLDLERTHLRDLAGIGALTGLTWLSVRKTKVASLAPLSGMAKLEHLDVEQLGHVAGTGAIGTLAGLVHLSVIGTTIDPNVLLPLSKLERLMGCAMPQRAFDLRDPSPHLPSDALGPGLVFDGRLGTVRAKGRPHDLDVSNRGERIAFTYTTNSNRGFAQVHNAYTTEMVCEIQLGFRIEGIVLSADGSCVYATVRFDAFANDVHLVKIAVANPSQHTVLCTFTRKARTRLVRNAQADLFAVLSDRVDLVNAQGEHLKSVVCDAGHESTTACFSADGASIYICGHEENHIVQSTIADGQVLGRWEAPYRSCQIVSVSTDGRYVVAVGGQCYGTYVYDTQSGERLLAEHFRAKRREGGVVVSRDGSLLVQLAYELQGWRTATEAGPLAGPSVTFSHDTGSVAAVVAWDVPMVAFASLDWRRPEQYVVWIPLVQA